MAGDRDDLGPAADAVLTLGALAALLAQRGQAGLPDALKVLVRGLGLRSALVRNAAGELTAAAGEVVHAVPVMRVVGPTSGRGTGAPLVELPVYAADGTPVAVLAAGGARPSLLPALRAAADVVGLVLGLPDVPVSPAVPPPLPHLALLDAEDSLDEIADALHDGPLQALVAARYAADAAVRGGDPEPTREAVQLALVSLRRTLWHLRPRGAEGLGPSLEGLSGRLVEAGGPPLRLVGGQGMLRLGDALTPAGSVTAYRLVQAVAVLDAPPVSVGLRRASTGAVLSVDGGGPLLSPERWTRRARSVGGDLSTAAGRLRLALPVTGPPADPARTGGRSQEQRLRSPDLPRQSGPGHLDTAPTPSHSSWYRSEPKATP